MHHVKTRLQGQCGGTSTAASTTGFVDNAGVNGQSAWITDDEKTLKAAPHNSARVTPKKLGEGSDDGSFLQEYFAYFKNKGQSQGTIVPGGADGGLCGSALRKTLMRFGFYLFRVKCKSGQKSPFLHFLPYNIYGRVKPQEIK